MDRSFKTWKTIRESKCSWLQRLDPTTALWQHRLIAWQQGGTRMPAPCTVQGWCLKGATRQVLQAFGHHWAAACRLTRVTTTCNSLRTGGRFHRRLSYIFIFRVTLTNLEKTFKRFFPDSFTSIVCNCFNKYQRSK